MRELALDLRRYRFAALAAAATAPALFALSRANYLLFHSLVELISVTVAFGTFTVAWNTRRTLENGYLLVLGLAMLFVGALDLVHTLGFHGMGVFPGWGANPATQLWIAARALESLSLVLAPRLIDRRVPVAAVVGVYALLTAGAIAAVLTGVFPRCYVEGTGLTPFKIAAEYVIIVILFIALRLLWKLRARFAREVFAALTLALALTAAAEASFTLYRDVTGLSNMLGHLLKLAAFLLIYRALVATAIVRPFDLLYRTLKEHEEALQLENTKLAAYQRELQAKNLELSELNAKKNELLGIAAHDIRSPLTVIEMYVALLEERLQPRADALTLRFLEIARHTSRKILDLVGNLLDFTSIESGTLSLVPQPLALRPLLEESLESHAALAQSKGIEIRLETDGDPPLVNADPLRIGQVIGNLLSNAVKFSRKGDTVTLRLFYREGQVGISVRDEGPGIPADAIPKIFTPFHKSGARGTAGEHSTGLGLAIVKKIADAHDARIEIVSEPGKGSTFTLLLPPSADAAETTISA